MLRLPRFPGKSAASESIRTFSGQLDGNIVPPTDDGVRLVEAKFEGQVSDAVTPAFLRSDLYVACAVQEWTMWDLSGRSKFRLLWDGFLQQVDAAILVVDCRCVARTQAQWVALTRLHPSCCPQ